MRPLVTATLLIATLNGLAQTWIPYQVQGCTVFSSSLVGKDHIADYTSTIDGGVQQVHRFFGYPFLQNFEVYIHPSRASLDSTWSKDWAMPDFKSECWMVASGVGSKLDLLSPAVWAHEACEHDSGNEIKTRQLITHELVHVYHGQKNPSPDFSETSGLDWFVEGLATYASGQIDSTRISQLKQGVSEGKVPATLDLFWTGKLRYGLSGSMVAFLDHKYGRAVIASLMEYKTKAEVLSLLEIDEPTLLKEWRAYVAGL